MRYIVSLLLLLSIHLAGNAQKRKEIKNDALEARDPKREFFIEMNDGSILTYENLKLKSPLGGIQHLEGDGKRIDIRADSIMAFQTEDFYALRLYPGAKNLGRSPFLSLFAERVRNGKIELFRASQMTNNAYGAGGGGSTSGYVSVYYIRKDKTSMPVQFSKEGLKSMIKDNKALLEQFDKLARQPNAYRIATEIIDEYN